MMESSQKRKRGSKKRFILILVGLTLPILVLGYAAWGLTGQTHLERGLNYQQDGRLTEAIIEFRNAVEKAPDLPQARQALGSAYLDTGKFPLALGEFTHLAQIDPENPVAHRKLGQVYLE